MTDVETDPDDLVRLRLTLALREALAEVRESPVERVVGSAAKPAAHEGRMGG